MADTNLGIGITGTRELVEYLRINHRPASLQLIIVEKAGRIEFEGAIDISHVDAKNHANQYFPAPGVDLSHPCILAINTISQHRIIFFNQWEKVLKVADIKLSIRIHKKDQIFSNGFKATNQCRTVSLVHGMANDFQASMSCGNGIKNRAGMILASIINYEDFIV